MAANGSLFSSATFASASRSIATRRSARVVYFGKKRKMPQSLLRHWGHCQPRLLEPEPESPVFQQSLPQRAGAEVPQPLVQNRTLS